GLALAEAGEIENIAGLGRRLLPRFVHEADGSFDNVAQLTRAAVDALQDRRGALQVISGENVGGRHGTRLLRENQFLETPGGVARTKGCARMPSANLPDCVAFSSKAPRLHDLPERPRFHGNATRLASAAACAKTCPI